MMMSELNSASPRPPGLLSRRRFLQVGTIGGLLNLPALLRAGAAPAHGAWPGPAKSCILIV
jgi:hypothetical protein